MATEAAESALSGAGSGEVCVDTELLRVRGAGGHRPDPGPGDSRGTLSRPISGSEGGQNTAGGDAGLHTGTASNRVGRDGCRVQGSECHTDLWYV